MPRSMMSAASSGGHFSSVARTVLATAMSGSCMASVISLELICMMRGRPVTWSRPRTSTERSCSMGSALPMAILISSAVCSPMSMLYFLRT